MFKKLKKNKNSKSQNCPLVTKQKKRKTKVDEQCIAITNPEERRCLEVGQKKQELKKKMGDI